LRLAERCDRSILIDSGVITAEPIQAKASALIES